MRKPRNISRRKFLQQSVSVAALSACSPSLFVGCGRRRARKIVIVGGGLAGLTAGYELTQAGHDVTILEARSRPGGRVHTLRKPFADGLYAEAGAARIQDSHHLTLKYAKHFGLTLDPFQPAEGAFVHYIRGRLIRRPVGQPYDLTKIPLEFFPEEKTIGMGGMIQKYIFSALDELGDTTAPDWPPASLKKYDEVSWVEFLRRQGASAGAIGLLTLGHDVGGHSALYLLQEFAHLRDTTGWLKIRGGNDLLPKVFAKQLRGKTLYSAPVVRIEQDSRRVRAVVRRQGETDTVEGDYLICAIPFSVLRDVDVSRPFSGPKQTAIEQMTYLSAARVFLQCSKRFWREDGFNGFGNTDHHMEIWDYTFDQPGDGGILVSYLTGVHAQKVTAMTENKRVRETVNRVAELFPKLGHYFESGTSKCWDEDRWARGAAAWLDPGQMTSLHGHAASPEGRVHFAGEHTSPWSSWMQGAIESGLRVVREINTRE